MSNRSWALLCWACVVAVSILILSPAVFRAAPQGAGGYHVIRNIPLGGEGGWDYITVDPDSKRIYAPRSEDIQVVDETSGKIIGDITGMKGLHGIAVAPEFNRGFVTGNEGPEAEIYLVDLKAMKVTDKIALPGAKGSDSLMYDPFSKRAFINTLSCSARMTSSRPGTPSRMIGVSCSKTPWTFCTAPSRLPSKI